MVIQRWQSVLLLISAVMMGIFSFSSIGQFQLHDYSLNFCTWGIYTEGQADDGNVNTHISTIYFLIISLLSLILYLIDIFLYKNLSLQKKVCSVAILTTIATISTGCVIGYTAVENGCPSWSSIVIAPFIAVFSGILAYRFISSDDRKLKSADRLR